MGRTLAPGQQVGRTTWELLDFGGGWVGPSILGAGGLWRRGGRHRGRSGHPRSGGRHCCATTAQCCALSHPLGPTTRADVVVNVMTEQQRAYYDIGGLCRCGGCATRGALLAGMTTSPPLPQLLAPPIPQRPIMVRQRRCLCLLHTGRVAAALTGRSGWCGERKRASLIAGA